jgi:hypothetical protein
MPAAARPRPSTIDCGRRVNQGYQAAGTQADILFYRNSFQIRLSASLLEEGAHTRIVCRFGMHPVVIAFLVFWFGALLFIGGGGIIAGVVELISGSRSEARDLVGLLIPALMLMFAAMILLVARYLAAGERLTLTGFVREALKASPSP